MKHLNKTIFTATLLTSFFLGQPLLADNRDHNQAATNGSISHDKHHANKDAIFGDTANHEGNAAGHSAGDVSHGDSIPEFTSTEHHAIKKLIFGNAVQGK